MAKCLICGQEMLTADGCACARIKIGGTVYDRIRVGGKGGMDETWVQGDPDFRCHDCGAKVGEFHHPGCDMEACPKCGEQLMCCRCRNIEIEKPNGTFVRGGI